MEQRCTENQEDGEVHIGPFADNDKNEIWCASTLLDHAELAQTDVLEPDPSTFQKAIANPHLRPFWFEGRD